MEITIINMIALICFVLLPLYGPSKRKRIVYTRPDVNELNSHYAINIFGELEYREHA